MMNQEHCKIAKSLSISLENRPSIEELSRINILHDNLDGNLQSAACKLEKEMSKNKLNKYIQSRPDIDDLKRHHILTDGCSHGALAAVNYYFNYIVVFFYIAFYY